MYNQRCYDMGDEYPKAMDKEVKMMDNMQYVGGECCNMCPPIMECPRERCCHRYICHEVPHVVPCNTRIINHHIYKHTYTPSYSCCEENEYCNVYEPGCC